MGDFGPETAAEGELAAMLSRSDAEIDLATANWLIAADLPGFRDMSRSEFMKLFNQAVDHIRAFHERYPDGGNPEAKAHAFCSAILAMGIDYREEFKSGSLTPEQQERLYLDARNLFLPGLLETGRGCCVSMPLLYVAAGRKLGHPVRLVTVGRHAFVRWDEPTWRMNIETTIVDFVAMSPNEDNFLEAEGLTREELAGTDALRNLTAREAVGNMLFTRAGHHLARFMRGKGPLRPAIRDGRRAVHLAPDNSNMKKQLAVLAAIERQLRSVTTPKNQSSRRNLPWKPPRPARPVPPLPGPPSPPGA